MVGVHQRVVGARQHASAGRRRAAGSSRPVGSSGSRSGGVHYSAPAVYARARMVAAERLALQAGEFAQMDYDFLFDRARRLLSIGYNVAEHRADQSYYDLLASEARLCSFVGIAQGHLPQDNWFAMGRLLVMAGGE